MADVPDYIQEAERLIMTAQAIRKRINRTEGDYHVYGMTGLALDLAAAREQLATLGGLCNVHTTPKETRDHDCG
jgi:hypothetical protein